jgi:ribosomal protein S18 acetylase RimI-like enzyme
MGRLGRIVVDLWHKHVRNRHHIYSCGTLPERVELPSGMAIERCDSWEAALPWMTALRERRTQQHIEQMQRELADHGVMWLALVDGKLAGYLWSRTGRYLPRWFVPLAEDDLVFFAATTFPEFRGRGIAPALMRYIMQQEMKGRGTAYVDCAQWNKAAARFFEKAGFTRIGTMRHYDR